MPGGDIVCVVAVIPDGLPCAEVGRAAKVIFLVWIDDSAVGPCGVGPSDAVELSVAVESSRCEAKFLGDLSAACRIKALARVGKFCVHKVGHPAHLRDVAVSIVVKAASRETAVLVECGMIEKALAECLKLGGRDRRLGGGLHGGEVGK